MLSLVGRAALIAAVGAGLGFVVNAARSDRLEIAGFAAPTTCGAALPLSTVEVLPPTQAVTLCGDPGVLVADARAAERFARGHVAGAVHLPCAAPGSAAQEGLKLVAGKHTVVVYGDTTDEARPVAESLRQRIAGPGVRVIVLDGGFPAWDAAGLACSSGPCTECKEQARR
jgi:3-mercaptopyruvate sulfurtransferase SseA